MCENEKKLFHFMIDRSIKNLVDIRVLMSDNKDPELVKDSLAILLGQLISIRDGLSMDD